MSEKIMGKFWLNQWSAYWYSIKMLINNLTDLFEYNLQEKPDEYIL